MRALLSWVDKVNNPEILSASSELPGIGRYATLNVFPFPLARANVKERHGEHAYPINPLTCPTPRDRQIQILQHNVHIYTVQNDRDELDGKVHDRISCSGYGIQPHGAESHHKQRHRDDADHGNRLTDKVGTLPIERKK